jgi:hypothetical protein
VQAIVSMCPEDTGYGFIKSALARDLDELLDALDKVLWQAKVRKPRRLRAT